MTISAHDLLLQAVALLRKRRRLIVYTLIGISGLVLDFTLFGMLVYIAELDFRLANFISVNCGIANNFVWNSLLNFRVRDRLLRRFALFYSVGLFGLAASHIILIIGVNYLHLNSSLSKAASLFVVLALQYNLNRLLTFRRS